jgi:energy-coupling factor transport system substrate-specific component
MTWQAASFCVLAFVLASGFAWYERSRPSAKVLALVAALAALAVVGRIAFAPIPNVKPTTDIVLFAGYALGGVPGFAVGAVTALASNLFFGQGPWTPWQMAAWGGVGVLGAGLARLARGREIGRVPLAVACGLAGLAFGAVMDTYQWTFSAGQTPAGWLAVSATSLPYNLAHAIGNVVFCLLIGPAFVRSLRRYRRRFEVRWAAPAPVAAAGIAALLCAFGAAVPAPAHADAADRAVLYLKRSQNLDGGFGGAPRSGSTQLHTGWASLGLAAAGQNPNDVRRVKKSSIDYIRTHARELREIGDVERTVLVLVASGESPRRFAKHDFVADLLSRRDGDGSFDRNIAYTAFGIFALRAAGAGSGAVRSAGRWLLRAQNRDGGFGFAPDAASDVDDTGAALQALAAAGRGRGAGARAAIGYLRRAQNPDGGFGQMDGRSSNAQSTAWAVQGLVAVGRNPERLRRGSRTPLGYIRSLQAGNGSVRYSRTSSQTPVWVTAQALTALERKPFPLERVPRRQQVRPAAKAAAAAPAASGGGGASRAERRAESTSARAASDGRRTARGRRPLPTVSLESTRTRARDADGPSEAIVAGVLGASAALTAGGWVWWRRRLRAPRSPA